MHSYTLHRQAQSLYQHLPEHQQHSHRQELDSPHTGTEPLTTRRTEIHPQSQAKIGFSKKVGQIKIPKKTNLSLLSFEHTKDPHITFRDRRTDTFHWHNIQLFLLIINFRTHKPSSSATTEVTIPPAVCLLTIYFAAVNHIFSV